MTCGKTNGKTNNRPNKVAERDTVDIDENRFSLSPLLFECPTIPVYSCTVETDAKAKAAAAEMTKKWR